MKLHRFHGDKSSTVQSTTSDVVVLETHNLMSETQNYFSLIFVSHFLQLYSWINLAQQHFLWYIAQHRIDQIALGLEHTKVQY